MFKEVSELYLKNRLLLAQFEINGRINIPIYIVNDGVSDSDFSTLLELVFPAIK